MSHYSRVVQGGFTPYPRLSGYDTSDVVWADQQPARCAYTYSKEELSPSLRTCVPFEVHGLRSNWFSQYVQYPLAHDGDRLLYVKEEVPEALRVLPSDYVPTPYTLQSWQVRPVDGQLQLQFSQRGRSH